MWQRSDVPALLTLVALLSPIFNKKDGRFSSAAAVSVTMAGGVGPSQSFYPGQQNLPHLLAQGSRVHPHIGPRTMSKPVQGLQGRGAGAVAASPPHHQLLHDGGVVVPSVRGSQRFGPFDGVELPAQDCVWFGPQAAANLHDPSYSESCSHLVADDGYPRSARGRGSASARRSKTACSDGGILSFLNCTSAAEVEAERDQQRQEDLRLLERPAPTFISPYGGRGSPSPSGYDSAASAFVAGGTASLSAGGIVSDMLAGGNVKKYVLDTVRVFVRATSSNLIDKMPAEIDLGDVPKATTVAALKHQLATTVLQTAGAPVPAQHLFFWYAGKQMEDKRAIGLFVGKWFHGNMRIFVLFDPTTTRKSMASWTQPRME